MLRTALYRVGLDDDVPFASMFLSNGVMACELPASEDPVVQEDAVQELFLAMCREEARHVHLTLYRDPTTSRWTGTYPARPDASGAELGPSRRMARGAMYAVGEAYLVDLPGVPRAYAAESIEVIGDLGRGEVTVVGRSDRLHGQFAFPGAGVAGTFRATPCLDDYSVLDVVEAGPTFFCP